MIRTLPSADDYCKSRSYADFGGQLLPFRMLALGHRAYP
jgi:hypothetical protein